MPREFRLNLTVTLPDGDFEEAEALVAIKPTVDAFQETLAKVMPSGVSLTYGVVTPKPRGAKDEGQ
jgi:hypothetical protein